MALRFDKGKARPTLPRTKDLMHVPARPSKAADAKPSLPRPGRERDGSGRFLPGNGAALGRGLRGSIRRLLGRDDETVTDVEARQVARDAERLFVAAVRELPSDGELVRQTLAQWAREAALTSFWALRASQLGLVSEEAVAASERARVHGTRAERLSVTSYDLASRLAGRRDAVTGGALARIAEAMRTHSEDGSAR